MTRLLSRAPLTASRASTLLIALLSLAFNTLSSLLLHQLPDDPFHLAIHYGLYLHFANVMSVFGFIGACRKHTLSILCFSNYLLLDTILSTIPRIFFLTLLSKSSSILCTPSSTTSLDFSTSIQTPSHPHAHETSLASYSISSSMPSSHVAGFADFIGKPKGVNGGWTETGCKRIIYLGYVTAIAGVMVAMGLQVLGALCVRDYAKGLMVKECNEEMANWEACAECEWCLRSRKEEREEKESEKERERERNERVKMVERAWGKLPLVLDREEESRKMTPIVEDMEYFEGH